MTDHDVLSGHSDQGELLLWVYLHELAFPGFVFFLLRPATALRKLCRDCALNPTRAACMQRRRVRRAGRAPRRQRGCHRASAGGRDDGSGGGDGGSDPPPLPPARDGVVAGGVS